MEDRTETELRALAKTNLKEALSHPACPLDILLENLALHYDLLLQHPRLQLWSLEDPEAYTTHIFEAREQRAKRELRSFAARAFESYASSKQILRWLASLARAQATNPQEESSLLAIQRWLDTGEWSGDDGYSSSCTESLREAIENVRAAHVLPQEIAAQEAQLRELNEREAQLQRRNKRSSEALDALLPVFEAALDSFNHLPNEETELSLFARQEVVPFINRCEEIARGASNMEEQPGVERWLRWLGERERSRHEEEQDRLLEKARQLKARWREPLSKELLSLLTQSEALLDHVEEMTYSGEGYYEICEERPLLEKKLEEGRGASGDAISFADAIEAALASITDTGELVESTLALEAKLQEMRSLQQTERAG